MAKIEKKTIENENQNLIWVQSFYTGDMRFWDTFLSKTDENEHLTVKMIFKSIVRLN